MGIFKYVAMDNSGNRRTGKVDARSKSVAISVLKGQGLYVVSLNEQSKSAMEIFTNIRGVPFTQLVTFTRQLSTMVSAGLSISKALDVLANQAESLKFQQMLASILRDVEGGSSLANSFAKHPETFNETYTALVAAGEASGKLDNILDQLADTMEAQRELRSKFKSAMIYPAIIFIAMIGVFFMLMIVVIPKLANMYESLNVELPTTTKILISISDFMVGHFIIVFLSIVGLVFITRLLLKSEGGKKAISVFLFKAPIFGSLNKKRELTEFTRTLSLLLSSAVPIVQSLGIVSNVVTNPTYRKGALDAATAIEKGGTLSSNLKANPAFPAIIGNMIATGEETGKLDEVLGRVADFYERETNHAVEGLSAALEPVILLMLGAMVGFLIISIITPIYQITSAI